MMSIKPVFLAAGIAAFGTALPAGAAEGQAAICEFYNHGDLKRDRSGPCSISDGSDEVTIDLDNGETYRFIPERKREGHYVDQDGNRLDVKHNNDYKRTYRWKNQRLIVQVAER